MAKQEKSAAELYREERKKRIAKAAKSNSKKHLSDKAQKGIVSFIAILLVVAIVGAISGGIVSNRGVFERNKIIMTIGDEKIDKYEYSYYYTSMLQNYVAQAIQYEMYGMSMGVDFTKSLAEQPYIDELEGYENPTFADYFEKSTIDSLKYVKACVAYAEENGITLTEEDEQTIADNYAQLDESRTNTDGTKYSVGAYLRLSYGKGMTEKLYSKILEEQVLAQRVMQVKQDEIKASYTEEEVEAAYNDGIESYGYVSYRSYAVKAEVAEGATAATEEALAAAKATAEEFAGRITDEESFKALAAEYAGAAGEEKDEDFLADDSLTLTEETTISMFAYDEADLEWIKSAKAGDTYVQKATDSYNVIYLVTPVHKALDTVETYDVRHILVKFPEATEEVTDGDVKEEVEVKEFDASAYDATVVNAVKTPITNVECYNEAIDILTSYLEGDKTEDAFAALAVEHSADGNAAQGGIYENVPLEGQGSMVDEFENWSIAEDRQPGDVGIVETNYGYHVMYHIGKVVNTWSNTIRTDLATEEYNAFYEELIAADNVAASELDADMKTDVNDNMASTAKNLYNNYKSYYSSYYGY